MSGVAWFMSRVAEALCPTRDLFFLFNVARVAAAASVAPGSSSVILARWASIGNSVQ